MRLCVFYFPLLSPTSLSVFLFIYRIRIVFIECDDCAHIIFVRNDVQTRRKAVAPIKAASHPIGIPDVHSDFVARYAVEVEGQTEEVDEMWVIFD